MFAKRDGGSFTLKDFLRSLKAADGSATFSFEYHQTHEKRFQETEKLLRTIKGERALEIGATDYFQVLLGDELGFKDVWGTRFADDPECKLYDRTVSAAGHSVKVKTLSIDIERELFPVAEGSFDVVLFCEVIEHLDIDPMFALAEFNRILRPGGKLLLTTPNCCSARNTWKILHGHRPHFFMQYERNRSPFRHNIEYDVDTLVLLLKSAGFVADHVATHDVFEEPMPKAVEFLKKNGLPTDHRGDDIFILATKTGTVTNRWPAEMYV